MRKAKVFVLALTLLAAACGAGVQPRPPSATPEPTPSTAGSPTRGGSVGQPSNTERVDPRSDGFEVGYGEFAIATEAKAIRPGRVTFVVRNGGKLVHGFEMKSESEGGSRRGPGRGERFEVEKPTFDPGETQRFTLTLAPGLYELECFVGNHDELGMRTMLEVREDAPLVRETARRAGRVDIEGFAFGPKTLEVPVGSPVTWRNDDPTPHTVTARDGSFGSDTLPSGSTFAFTFGRAGEFRYYCAIHPAMEGVIRVTG